MMMRIFTDFGRVCEEVGVAYVKLLSQLLDGTKVNYQSLRITGTLVYESHCADTLACPLVLPATLTGNAVSC